MNLITGTTGLVGSHLALHLLENGEKVRGIFRSQASKDKTLRLFKLYGKESLFGRIDWVEAEICNIPNLEKAFAGVEYVYHCAALISFDDKDEEAMRKINIEGTANVVNLSLDFGVKKLVHVSSVAALGDLKEGETVLDEESDWNPEKHHSDYGISKYGAEMEIWRGQQEGLDVAAVVPGIILGPGFWDDGSGALFQAIENGFPFYTMGSTGFVAVKDLVSAMVKLMKSDISNERYILIGNHFILRDMAFMIADALAVKRPGTNAKPWLIKLAVAADWFASLFRKKRKLFSETASALHRHREFSTQKIKKDLGFEFTDIPTYIKEIVRIQKGK
ncbi:MAG: NAD-dependent epimerase/dehydratase family protein [Flavobacterium sp.]|uniref:NAD-dependent epimerase/dehydratase family protein n=1 Tax=Flavobacterium sp. TaxID=239 RepID=UPI001213E2B4|nr:NAD-dependent epimerase/dehydratase family protein [Flavobacterium sp.]RZJ68617.1 MAG: NAD-dependent epimerase/dehydratase family protein [Flavobacterium sp.]